MVPIDSLGTLHQAAWIQEVSGGFGMAIDLCSLLSPPPCGPGVIEMNVGDEDMTDLLQVKSPVANGTVESRKCRAGTRLDQGELTLIFDQISSNEAGSVSEEKIERMDGHGMIMGVL